MDVWGAYERLVDTDPDVRSLQEQRLVALGELRADVNSGGFHQYFSNAAGNLVLEALHAARSVSAIELASLIERALDVLHVEDPTDRDAREEGLMKVDVEAFETLDEAYYALEGTSELDEVMSRVLRAL